jgi:hypothetical protein
METDLGIVGTFKKSGEHSDSSGSSSRINAKTPCNAAVEKKNMEEQKETGFKENSFPNWRDREVTPKSFRGLECNVVLVQWLYMVSRVSIITMCGTALPGRAYDLRKSDSTG